MVRAFAKILNREKPAEELRNFSGTSSIEKAWTSALLHGIQSSSGIKVTPLKALGVATVYSCVNILARTVATLPLNLYRRLPDGGKEIAVDHPLNDILHSEAGPFHTSTDFRMMMEGHRALRNNAFALITKNNGEDVVELKPVPPEDVYVRVNPMGEPVYHVKGDAFFSESVLHIKGYSRDGVIGSDLITTVNDVLGLAVALEENANKFFKNNSRPGGVLSHPGSLSDKAFERLRSEMETKHSGVENAYKLMILEEGLKYEASRTDNKDAQFDESRDRQDRAIARIFGVPNHKLGLIDSMPRANMEQENIGFVTNTIRPICVAWEQELSKKLLTRSQRSEYFIEFNLEGLLRGDMAARYAAYSQGRQWGWLSVNEIRRKENMNPIGEQGDVYLQPVNMVPAGETNEEQGNETNI